MKKLGTILTLTSLVAACGNSSKLKIDKSQLKDNPAQCTFEGSEYGDYKKCDLKIDDLMMRLGNPKADFKIVFIQGGPMPDFNITKESLRPIDDWYAAQNVEWIFVRQAQWNKIAQFKNLNGFDSQDAEKETFETLENANKIIKKFKNEGFNVALTGGSYGGILINEYINQFGTDDPDHIIQMVSKVNLGDENSQIKMEMDGNDLKQTFFNDENKIEGWFYTVKDYPEKFWPLIKQTQQVASMLLKPLFKDYTELLANKDLSKVTYINAVGDRNVGYLTPSTKEFLKSKGAQVVEFSIEDVEKAMATYKEKTGKDWSGGSMGNARRTAAHKMPNITEEHAIKYILEPIGWNKQKYYNDSVNFYKFEK